MSPYISAFNRKQSMKCIWIAIHLHKEKHILTHPWFVVIALPNKFRYILPGKWNHGRIIHAINFIRLFRCIYPRKYNRRNVLQMGTIAWQEGQFHQHNLNDCTLSRFVTVRIVFDVFSEMIYCIFSSRNIWNSIPKTWPDFFLYFIAIFGTMVMGDYGE